MTDDMLEVARRNAPIVADRIGFANVQFVKGRIQDLGLDLERLDAELRDNPIGDANSFLRAQEIATDLRVSHPLIASDSVDVVVSNCVLNLVDSRDKQVLFSEIFPISVRSIAIPFFTIVTSLTNYVVQKFFPWQLENMGMSSIFLFYASTVAIGLAILFFTLKETKNMSIEEIQLALSSNSKS